MSQPEWSFDDIQPEFLSPDDPTDDIVTDIDEPNPDLIKQAKARGLKAKQYEKKVRSVLFTGHQLAIGHPNTIADAAAIIMYGPNVASKAGDLAAANETFAKAVDFITDGAENPAAAFMVSLTPMVMQVLRDHEPALEPSMRGIKLPFTQRRLKFKFGIKLGNLRNLTNDPDAMVDHVYGNPAILAALTKQGIDISPVIANRKRKRDRQY